jgi:hypothetical protein
MSVPLWKVKREFRASYDQLLASLIRLCFPVIRLKHRLFPFVEPTPIKGHQTLGHRVVLYLVFPDSDDLEDRLGALDYFLSQSTTVVCVVNGEVSEHWLGQLAQRCAYVLIRDNKGYDFGGYQRGIRFLTDLGHHFDHLHIINDSVIMPVVQNTTIFTDIEAAATSGFGGAVALPMGKHDPQVQLVLSYWLYFSGRLARSSCFAKYWSRYVATKSKVLTVRYGERGISHYMVAQGYRATALHTVESLTDMLQGLTAESLTLILQYGSFTDDDFAAQCAHLLTDQADLNWPESARAFIMRVALRRNFLHSFCYLTYEVLQIPFIKKTRIRLPYMMRKQYVSAVHAGQMVRPAERVWTRVLDISR